MKHPYISVFLLALIALGTEGVQARIWTNIAGKKIEAEFVSVEGQTAELKLPSGKTAKVPLMSLSEEDRQFIQGSGKQTPSKGNFDSPWPKNSKDPGNYEVAVIKDGPDEFIYETPNFRFVGDVKLGKAMMKKISTVFEATYEANRSLPISNMPWFVDNEKFRTRFFVKTRDYHVAGGPSGSAGVFVSGGEHGPLGEVMVPVESLPLKEVGTVYMEDRDKDPSVLIHEITHQMMSRQVKSEAWFIEGSAEYVALTPYGNGRFNFNTTRGSIVDGVTGYGKKNKGGRVLGKDIKALSIKRIMTMEYQEFTGPQANQNYGLAPMIVYYFYHIDGKGDAARIKTYVKALQDGKSPEEARALLLDGRSYDDLAKEISIFWRRSGVTIDFQSSNQAEPTS